MNRLQLQQPDRGERRGLAAALAGGVHLLLIGLLVFGMQWQVKRDEPVSVELWASLPKPSQVLETPKPRPEPKIKPKPAPEPEPPAAHYGRQDPSPATVAWPTPKARDLAVRLREALDVPGTLGCHPLRELLRTLGAALRGAA